MEEKTQQKPVEILLVEDNPGDIRLIVETLKEGRLVHKISVARDGEEALRMLAEGSGVNPEIILLDLKIPKKNGLEVLAELRKKPHLKDTPVIVLTSSESEKDIAEAYEKLANCYVTKPIDLDKFIVTINSIENYWVTVVKAAQNKAGG